MPRKRNNRIHICLTDDELAHVNELSKLSGLSREAYTRMLYKNLVPRPCPSTELLECIQQLRRIGNNINQIAFLANATSNIDSSYFKECFKELQMEIFNIKQLVNNPFPFN